MVSRYPTVERGTVSPDIPTGEWKLEIWGPDPSRALALWHLTDLGGFDDEAYEAARQLLDDVGVRDLGKDAWVEDGDHVWTTELAPV